jgi:uncharacterized protein (DUF1697 family)
MRYSMIFRIARIMTKSKEQTARMSVHIALLRAVNVAGHNPIVMAELRNLLIELGFVGVRSLLQTGNLVFRSKARISADLEEFLEAEAANRHQLRTDFFVRHEAEWKQMIANNPFQEEASRDPSHLVVMLLKQAPAANAVGALQASITGPERVSVDGSQAYLVYPAGIGRSRLTNAFVERKLGTRGTSRNWNTILKLEAAISEATH